MPFWCVVPGVEDGWMNVMSLSLINQSADWRLADEGIQVDKYRLYLECQSCQFEVNALGNWKAM